MAFTVTCDKCSAEISAEANPFGGRQVYVEEEYTETGEAPFTLPNGEIEIRESSRDGIRAKSVDLCEDHWRAMNKVILEWLDSPA